MNWWCCKRAAGVTWRVVGTASALVAVFAAGCTSDDSGAPMELVPTETAPPKLAPLVTGSAPAGFPPGPIAETGPSDNQLTEERAQLGKRLFFEPRLSRTSEIACVNCHDPKLAFADARPVSLGVEDRMGTRNAPALVNLTWGQRFFWDGRAETLEEQAGMPIEDPLEMDLPLATAAERLTDDPAYVQEFQLAYGSEPTPETLRKALASFLRTLVSGDSAYDRYLAGDLDALAPAALRGEALFFGDAACFHCHPPGALTNEGFFNNGTFYDGGDVGRQKVTGRTGDLGKFKVPGLRNVAVTGPFMHDGSLETLVEVVAHYNRGGLGHPSTDPLIEPLGLSDEQMTDLVAFLEALTDSSFLEDPRFRP